jgi:hypothetical protein
MSAAELVARLAQQGIDPTLLAEVAQELFLGEQERKSLAERRKNDRERKARSRDGTGQDGTSNVVPLRVSLDKETSPRPPKEINPIPCVKRARGVWHRLPEDWVPRPLPAPVQAKVDLWPPGRLDDELASFRRWAANAEDKNGKGRKLDWDQAWRNWVTRRHDERYTHTGSKNLSAAASAFGDPSTWRDDVAF